MSVTSYPEKEPEQTYSASITGLVAGALPTDIFTIIGSATKIVKILHIDVSGIRLVNGHSDIKLLKRSTANTVGTSTLPTVVPHDSNNNPGTAVVNAYTVNPTLGALVGEIKSEKAFINTVGSGASDHIRWNNDSEQGVAVLRGINELIAVNLNGVTITGNNFSIFITWTEKDL
jgi:hypothetical protein